MIKNRTGKDLKEIVRNRHSRYQSEDEIKLFFCLIEKRKRKKLKQNKILYKRKNNEKQLCLHLFFVSCFLSKRNFWAVVELEKNRRGARLAAHTSPHKRKNLGWTARRRIRILWLVSSLAGEYLEKMFEKGFKCSKQINCRLKVAI